MRSGFDDSYARQDNAIAIELNAWSIVFRLSDAVGFSKQIGQPIERCMSAA
jgi:hypothetical protein